MAETLDIPVDERLAQLVKRTSEGDNQISGPKIQRVSAVLRQNLEFAKYCSPKIVSFGPIHHRNKDLNLGEQFKIQWTSLYIEEYSKKTAKSASEAAHFLHKIVKDKLRELKKLFSKDVTESYNDEELAWMLFVDGCSLLYYMHNVDIHRPQAVMLKIDQLIYILNDILLLENQLPRTLLELLSINQGADLESLMYNAITVGKARLLGITEVIDLNPKPTHILDYYHSHFIDTEYGKNVGDQNDGAEHNHQISPPPNDQDVMRFWRRYKNIRDLKTAGIRVMANKIDPPMQPHDISFNSGWFGGELRLPLTRLGSISPHLFRNLIAYEMCPDFHNNFKCCSFFSFMDSLIDDVDDVKELRLAGVLLNELGSDEDAAKLFNELGNYLPTQVFNYMGSDAVAYSKKFIEVKVQIEEHYNKIWHKWLAEARSTYFNNPWSLIAFLAALLALALTFIQTWCVIHPK